MSEINTGWLEDTEGVTFAPKTLVDSVQDADGTPLRDMLGGREIDAEQVIMADGKSVEETVSSLKTSLNGMVFGKGNHTLNDIVCAGYLTGSGNYVDFTIPIHLADDVENASITNLGSTTVYTPTTAIVTSSLTVETIRIRNKTLFVELKFSSTQAKSICANVRLANLAITLS